MPTTDVERPGSVQVTVADQVAAKAVGVPGVVMSLTRSDKVASSGRVRLRVDYSGFANAYGANYGDRLRLVALPACALTTPQKRECQRQTPLPSVNMPTTTSVSVDVDVAADPSNAPAAQAQEGQAAPMVVAVTSSASSSSGDFGATSLSPAYSWAAGNQGGSFTYNYPFKVPASLGGPAPDLALSYDSGAIDGQTVRQNGQTSWVGEGWNLEPGYIERSYRPCSQDGGSTADLCWFSAYNATMVFGGKATRLVRDNATGVWHAADDSGLKIENLTGTSNWTKNGEYWRVTALDGTQYYFGINKRYAGDTADTAATLPEPVFGNNPGEPCYNSGGFASSWCELGYRWNLDYVVDPRGNSMTYYYAVNQQYVGINGNTNVQPYLAGAVLDHIDYGTRAGSEASSTAPMRVVFTKTDRCFQSPSTPCSGHPENWPDTPWDLNCNSSPAPTSCPNTQTPAYWTSYRLTSVTSQVWDAGKSAYRNVDKWDLTHQFPASGDYIAPAGNDSSPNLWLASITHTGYAADGTTSLAEPTMTFGGTRMVNRKNWGNDLGLAPLMHYRVTRVNTGTGAETVVNYSGQGEPFSSTDCVRDWDPLSQINPNRCFPVYAKPVTMPNAGWDWFHKYVVTSVTNRDLTGGSPDETWSYAYSTANSSDPALWHHDYNETVQLAYRSWTQWQGYSTVTVTHGPAGGPQTVTTNIHHRGMDGDGLASTDNQSMVWNARRVGVLAPLGTPGTIGAISGRGGRCLDVALSGTADGTNVQLYTCNTTGAQIWRYNWTDLTFRNPQSGKCLNIAGSAWPGTNVNLSTCTAGNAYQVWQRQPNGSLRNPYTGRCLDIAGGVNADATNVQLNDCSDNLAQVWLPQADGSMLNPQAARCVDVSSSGTADGTKVQSYRCNSTGAQLWQTLSNGTLKNPQSGKCLDTASGGTANNTLIQLWTCNGATSQVWAAQADGSLKNTKSGRCLDAPNGNGVNGLQLQISDCTGGPGQIWVNNFTDADGTRGFGREQQTLDGGTLVSSTIHEPTVTRTAVRSKPNDVGEDLSALMVTETATRSRTWIAATNTWRWTETNTAYDSYGLPTDVKDLGDTATAADDRCTHTDYARDTGKGLINFPSQVTTTTCAANPGDGDYLEGAQTFYDGTTTVGATPTKGLPTKTTALASVASGTRTWKQAARTDYDAYGRPTTAYDALDRKTTTGYTPASGGPVTASSVTNSAGWTTTTTVDSGKDTPTSVVDINGKTTTAVYDPLGRLTKVWRNNRPTTDTPDNQYTYTLSSSAPNSVQTQKLGPAGQQITSYVIYDGLLRPRQTQTPAPQNVGGRVVSETVYDGRGLPAKTSTFWNSASGPTGSLVAANDANVANQHRFSYDTLQRQTVDALYSNNTLKWQTTTSYDGDRSTVTPPAGGTPTTTITDARGQTVTLRQYLNGAPSGAFQDTSYGYDRLGRQTSVTDPAGNTWTTSYDLRGRVTQAGDPDKGTITSTYDDAGQLLTSTDDRKVTLAYTYDGLGRKTELWKDAAGTGTKLADWTFDTLANGSTVKGQAAAANRYANGTTYTTLVTGYDDAYRPLGTTVRIPAAETGLAGDWTTTTAYNVDGSVASTTYPAAAGLGAETVTTSYDNVGLPTTLAGLDTYIASTQYYYWGAVKQQLLGAAPKQVKLDTAADEATGRLTQLSTGIQTGASTWTEKLTENYTYNPAGQVTSIAETTAGEVVSNQCFSYDGLRQLTEAWTTTATSCQTTPSQAVVGGPDPYWTSYRYDTIGNRTTDTTHIATGDTTRSYTYPAAKTARPHAVTSVTATTGTSSYTYDEAGNTKTRNLAGKPGQTLTWDFEGHLASIADSAGTASYLYDAAGNRLIARDASGTTLYLAGTEVRRDAAGAISATRFYGSTAVRTNPGGLTWLAADHHGTTQLAINSSDLSTTRRKTDPFGNPRGTQPTWPTTHGFVNGVTDPTGLTHLGAREYDPGIGRFISVDPILDVTDPQQTNGYSYANNNPTTASDPDGLRVCLDECGGPDDKYVLKQQVATRQAKAKANSAPSSNARPSAPVLTAAQQAAYENAQKVKKQTLVDVLIDQGLKFVLDLIGVTDIVNCFTKGDLWACGNAALNAMPWGKALKIGKDIFKALTRGFEAYKTWQKAVKFADEVIARTQALLRRGCHSFDPRTPVLMADGTRKAIKDVKVDDKVVTTDPDTGQTTTRPVTALHINKDTDLTDVILTGADGHTQILHTTQHHPFWDETSHAWVDAADLQAGHRLRTTDGSVQSVATIRNFTGQHEMRDLTVADIHTYYVLAGNTPVLVHNCGSGNSDDLIHVYRAAQRGNGADELASGLNPARHAGGNGLAYIGTEDVAQKYADYSVGTHEDYYTKFTFKRSEFEEHFGTGLPYEGGPGLEWEIPHGKIDLFNHLTLNREKLWAPW
ncbi:ricin-type beta-trefoil lectin domain protein [Planosporangium sp. 12N6]|uniref:ricin-type beta-trefoil lectin domain protein n=1 Tax=Planosporangium spinosum TaxID=3402278 RepID=UPI003CF3A1C3